MPNRKLSTQDIHQVSLDLAKQYMDRSNKSWEYDRIVSDFTKKYNGFFEEFVKYNNSCDANK